MGPRYDLINFGVSDGRRRMAVSCIDQKHRACRRGGDALGLDEIEGVVKIGAVVVAAVELVIDRTMGKSCTAEAWFSG